MRSAEFALGIVEVALAIAFGITWLRYLHYRTRNNRVYRTIWAVFLVYSVAFFVWNLVFAFTR